MAKPGPSRKAIIGWGVGMFVVLALAWFVGLWVVPCWQARSALNTVAYDPEFGLRLPSALETEMRYFTDPRDLDGVAARLGGKEPALRKLGVYLKSPDSLADRKHLAVAVLSRCGGNAVPRLMSIMGDTCAEGRVRIMAMAGVCHIAGEQALTAEPLLEKLLADADTEVRQAAREALRKIREEEGK